MHSEFYRFSFEGGDEKWLPPLVGDWLEYYLFLVLSG